MITLEVPFFSFSDVTKLRRCLFSSKQLQIIDFYFMQLQELRWYALHIPLFLHLIRRQGEGFCLQVQSSAASLHACSTETFPSMLFSSFFPVKWTSLQDVFWSPETILLCTKWRFMWLQLYIDEPVVCSKLCTLWFVVQCLSLLQHYIWKQYSYQRKQIKAK